LKEDLISRSIKFFKELLKVKVFGKKTVKLFFGDYCGNQNILIPDSYKKFGV
jgi:hypothetical protein